MTKGSWPPGLSSSIKRHPLHDLLPGVVKNVLYSLPFDKRDKYVIDMLIETSDARRRRNNDIILASHVARQARDRELEWPLIEAYPKDQRDTDEKLDEIFKVLHGVIVTMVEKSYYV